MTEQLSPIAKLEQGYWRFRTGTFERERWLYEHLVAKGQKPKVMIVGCADSRVDPTVVTDAGPGEVFTVRNVANLVPPCESQGKYHGTSAALEFAVRDLKVEHIVVLGHSQCGGIAALYDGLDKHPEERSFISPWVSILADVRDGIKEQYADATREQAVRALEHAAIGASLLNLVSFDFISQQVEAGKLFLHGWHFDIASGSINALNHDSHKFEPLGPANTVSN